MLRRARAIYKGALRHAPRVRTERPGGPAGAGRRGGALRGALWVSTVHARFGATQSSVWSSPARASVGWLCRGFAVSAREFDCGTSCEGSSGTGEKFHPFGRERIASSSSPAPCVPAAVSLWGGGVGKTLLSLHNGLGPYETQPPPPPSECLRIFRLCRTFCHFLFSNISSLL